MTKITRKDLARGTKLTREHVFDPLQAAANELSNVNIGRANLINSWGSFRINIHIPTLDARYFSPVVDDPIRFAIPFTLPPLQEYFSALGARDEFTPELILDEFQMSFDQRAESAGLQSNIKPAGQEGLLNYDALDQLGFSVALLEKEQWIYDKASTNYDPQSEIFSTDLPAELFSGVYSRQNPVIVSPLGKVLTPYRTYMLVLDANSLYDPNTPITLPSLTLSLKIRHPLVPRDTGVANVQNIPTVHGGNQSPDTVTITLPTAGSIISADAAQGIQTNIKTIDQVLQAKLRGGYGKDSNVPVTEHLADDASYEVVMIPVWAGYSNNAVLTAGTAADTPDALVAPYTTVQQDANSVPIAWPMTIHHVLLHVNHQSPSEQGLLPTSPTFQQSVSVGIGTGLQADNHTYQDIANLTWDTATVVGATVDRALNIQGSGANGQPKASSDKYDWETLACPIVTGTQGAGVGYYPQGKPFFVGKASSAMWGRSNVGNGNAGKPWTEGAEQFLQVNWSLQDPVGLSDVAAIPPGGAGTSNEVYVGYQGNWVQIVAKKHIIGLGNEIKI